MSKTKLAVACAVLFWPAFPSSPRIDAQAQGSAASVPPNRALLTRYCLACHNDRLRTGGLSLATIDTENMGAGAEVWEKVVRKLRGGAMPPPGLPRPDPATAAAFVARLEEALDRAAAATPNPGLVPVHRLNRAEYANSIRDLLAVDVDARARLPADDADAHGFDNNAGVLSVSPTLLERYLAAARTISRMAIGDPAIVPGFDTYQPPKMMLQDERMSEDLPFGSRGGLAVRHHFPLDGTYVVRIRLQRQLYDYIRGLGEPHDLDVRLDGALIKRFRIGGESKRKPAPATYAGNIPGDRDWEDYMHDADAGLEVKFPAKAGTRVVGVSFVNQLVEPEGILQPRVTGFTVAVDELWDGNPAIDSVLIGGPYDASVPTDTAARQRIFVCSPDPASERSGAGREGRRKRSEPSGVKGPPRVNEDSCARRILTTLVRRAFRRPSTTADVDTLFRFFVAGRRESGFDIGIQRALERLLADPEFIFRIERTPANVAPGTAYRISDVELASRLSFFLWSSAPDDELLDVAARGWLRDPAMLRHQVERMLADRRSHALIENFADQWLTVRNIRGVTPDPDLFPEFDDNLREAFQRETELFVESQVHENRSVVDLLTADYTFVNERLARHYGIPNVYGEQFRRVSLGASERRGLLGHGSILTTTSYANRTSPVLRGKWVLDNVLGTPPPPPPPNVPDLVEKAQDGKLRSVRERLEQHRKNPACATCHVRMDPLGFALENFDAIGAWRTRNEAGGAIDASETLPDGTHLDGIASLREYLLGRRDAFAGTVAEKLLMYALGRGLEYYDYPAVRQIVRQAAPRDYRWSSVILGVVTTPPFQWRGGERGGPKGPRLRPPPERGEGSPRRSNAEVRAMIITKKALPRRTVLRGIGASLALPLLDGMAPALTAFAKTPAKPAGRLGVVYVPNGIVMKQWLPSVEGAVFELTPTLNALAPFRDRLVVLSGLNSRPPASQAGQATGVHARASTRFLTGVPPKFTASGSEVEAGISVDQIVARELGQHTQLASLELALESSESAGTCDLGFSCAYTNTISWRSPRTPLPMEHNPRAVFERLFGDGGTSGTAARLARMRRDRSILDSVSDKVAQLERGLGARDRAKLGEYLDAVRDVERRIQNAEEQSTRELPAIDQPAGVPASFADHAKLMFDLQVLAYQSDLTRVATFMMGREFSGRTYPEIGVPDAHHPISHHQGDQEKLAKLAKINRFHMELFASYVDKLRSTADGDGSLLDHMILVYGAGMSDSNAHSPENLPVLLLGGANGQIKGGRHLRFDADTPLGNLHVTLLEKIGIEIDRLGDSNGRLEQLSAI